MKKPVVFDGLLAKKIGVECAVLYQKIVESEKEFPTINDIDVFFWSDSRKKKVFSELKETNIIEVKGNGKIHLTKISIEDINGVEVPSLKNKYPEPFEKIWKHYNREKHNPGSKKDAFEKWKKSKLSKIRPEIAMHIIDLYREDIGDTTYMKHLKTFISQEVYEDYAPSLVRVKDKQGNVWNGYLFSDNTLFAIKGNNSLVKVDLPKKDVESLIKNGGIEVIDD